MHSGNQSEIKKRKNKKSLEKEIINVFPIKEEDSETDNPIPKKKLDKKKNKRESRKSTDAQPIKEELDEIDDVTSKKHKKEKKRDSSKNTEVESGDGTPEYHKKSKKRKSSTSLEESPAKKPVVEDNEQNLSSNVEDDEFVKAAANKLKDLDRRSLFIRAEIIRNVSIDKLMKMAPGIIDIRRKGKIAYIEFKSEKKTEAGFKKLHESKFEGELLFVDYVGDKSRNLTGGKQTKLDPLKLYVKPIPKDITKEHVQKIFPKAAGIKLMNPDHSNNGFAIVSFKSREDAKEGFEMNNVKIAGTSLSVLYANKIKKANNPRKKSGNKRNGRSFSKRKQAKSEKLAGDVNVTTNNES